MPSSGNGSTYLLAIVTLLVLSLLGGALVLLHQTERSAAGNQVGFTKTLYAAESAIGLALARALIQDRSEPFVLLRDLRRPRDGALPSLSEEIEALRFEVVREEPCQFCSLAPAERWLRRSWAVHVVGRQAYRSAVPPGSPGTVASEVHIQATVRATPVRSEDCHEGASASAEPVECARVWVHERCAASQGPLPSWEIAWSSVQPADVDCDHGSDGASPTPWWPGVEAAVRLFDELAAEVSITEVVFFSATLAASFDEGRDGLVGMVAVTGGPAIWSVVTEGTPTAVSVVDADHDSLADGLYFGTSSGRLLRGRIAASAGEIDSPVDLRVIFDTEGLSISEAPTIVLLGDGVRVAVAFGSGSPGLTCAAGEERQRVFVLADDPRRDRSLRLAGDYVLLSELALGNSRDLLASPGPAREAGWVLDLESGESLAGEITALAGLMMFGVTRSLPVGGDGGRGEAPLCSVETVVYRLLMRNGDAADGVGRRLELGALASSPLAITADAFDEELRLLFEQHSVSGSDLITIRDRLQDLAPPSCRFGAFAVRFVTSLDAFTKVPLAEVPMCIEIDDWSETRAALATPPFFG